MWSMLHRTSQKYHKKFGRLAPTVSNKRAGHVSVTAHMCLHGKTITNTFTARKGKSSCWRRLKFYNFTLTAGFQQWGFETDERCFRMKLGFLHLTAHTPHADPTAGQVSWKQWPDSDAVELCGPRDRICVMNLGWIYCQHRKLYITRSLNANCSRY